MLARRIGVILLTLAATGSVDAWAADAEALRVPTDQFQAARDLANPLPPMPELIEKGKALYHGKAFCVACHGRDGTGLGDIPGLRGALPRNFTDKA
jgi:cytochrome c553